MRATLTDEQDQLRAVAADLAAAGRPAAPAARGRVAEATDVTANLMDGFAGLGVPEDAGGMGGGLVEVALVAHELGRHVVPTPWTVHAMAMQVALAAGLDVTDAVAGRQLWTLASDEVGAAPLGPWEATVEPPGGTKSRVPHVESADRAVVTHGDDSVAVLAAGGAEPGPTLDLGRPGGGLVVAGSPERQSSSGARAGLIRAMSVLAAELVGVGRGAVDLATAYANQREQFGQPIGRFQGVSFQLAEALVAVEEAWSLTLYAAWAADADDAQARMAVQSAKAKASEAAVHATERATQVHGGVGITWEAMPHLFLRRAMSSAVWLGDTAWHRRQVGSALLAS